MSETKALTPIMLGERGVQLTTLEDAFRFSTAIAKSGLAPRGLDTPEKILVALQTGLELGLTPMRALSQISVVGGRPSIMGDAALALCRRSCAMMTYDEGADETHGWAESTRLGGQRMRREFSVADAQRAGLWGKAGPWQQYPRRMLMLRARGFLLRDLYGDVLTGIYLAEELEGVPPVTAEIPGPLTTAPPPDPDPLLAEMPARSIEELEPLLADHEAALESPTPPAQLFPDLAPPSLDERRKKLRDAILGEAGGDLDVAKDLARSTFGRARLGDIKTEEEMSSAEALWAARETPELEL